MSSSDDSSSTSCLMASTVSDTMACSPIPYAATICLRCDKPYIRHKHHRMRSILITTHPIASICAGPVARPWLSSKSSTQITHHELPQYMTFTNFNPSAFRPDRLSPVPALLWLLLPENRNSAPRDQQSDQYKIKKSAAPNSSSTVIDRSPRKKLIKSMVGF